MPLRIRVERITKRGQDYLRTLLIQGARSVVATASRLSDPTSRWILQLQQRAGWQKTLVAVANKNARIVWAVLVRGRSFEAHYVNTSCPDLRHSTYLSIDFSLQTRSEDAPNRSDRQRVNSANRQRHGDRADRMEPR